ncbi:hypothetical protein BJY21_003182 [Kineosphaera limosa]|uniref:2TM domain-containing protein n=1 Tax=Kineosphaera limosa NBRC 100340 TaxID=1184609 RepID=K6XE39_9MICO|nr:2TM domain-containing protein [Kineosphaera limosa]NYE01998.1 hypothetical protein [Kineosphaera limosa]GAB97104.1 hypothetical protein KILIM_056_00280 [Kineosphaera limosa NBRC 100340]
MSGDNSPIEPYRPPFESDPAIRRLAIRRIAARRAFVVHASVYATVMIFLIVVWVASGAGYFWPIWPMMGWGLGLALHGMSLTWNSKPSEKEIAQEADKIRRRRLSDGPQD